MAVNGGKSFESQTRREVRDRTGKQTRRSVARLRRDAGCALSPEWGCGFLLVAHDHLVGDGHGDHEDDQEEYFL